MEDWPGRQGPVDHLLWNVVLGRRTPRFDKWLWFKPLGGTVITPGRNDELGFRAYYWPDYYSGTLMTPINLQYGFFVARVRLPNPFPALSPAFWILQGQDVQSGPHGNLSDEWDIQEMFSNQVRLTQVSRARPQRPIMTTGSSWSQAERPSQATMTVLAVPVLLAAHYLPAERCTLTANQLPDISEGPT